jgi:hypothetical protein
VRAVTVLRLAKGLGLTEDLIRVSEHGDGNEERAATTEREMVRVLACCEEVMERKKCLDRIRCLISSSLLQAIVHRHLYCWAVEMVIHLTGLQCKG